VIFYIKTLIIFTAPKKKIHVRKLNVSLFVSSLIFIQKSAHFYRLLFTLIFCLFNEYCSLKNGYCPFLFALLEKMRKVWVFSVSCDKTAYFFADFVEFYCSEVHIFEFLCFSMKLLHIFCRFPREIIACFHSHNIPHF
jgi:hypothetical protein